MRRVISVIVLNEHGVLSRIVGLFSGRGYNIESLTVAPVPNSEFSRINIVTIGDEHTIEQIIKQLHKLISTYKVIDSGEFVEREMVLLKISLNEDYIIVMACDEADRIENFIKVMKKYNPSQIVRSGSVMMEL